MVCDDANLHAGGLLAAWFERRCQIEALRLLNVLAEIAIDNQHLPSEVFSCAELMITPAAAAVLDRCRAAGCRMTPCSTRVFEKLAYRSRTDGLLAVAPQVGTRLEALTAHDHMLLVVAEAVEKPGNLGTILRSADGAGADAVIVCDRCTDINNPNVVRASLGTVFSRPVIEATSEAVLAWLQAHRVAVLAATPGARQVYSDTDMCRSIAMAVGAEKPGLSERWLQAADTCVRIPMRGQADSLNVAASTTLLLYEAVRQRTAARTTSGNACPALTPPTVLP